MEIQFIIISVIVAIVIFFLCRELMCWYYKINKLVTLLEEQNNLLKQQLGIIPLSIPGTFNPTHKTAAISNIEGVSLRKEPLPGVEPFTRIPNGTEVQHLNTGKEVKMQDRTGLWYEVITKDNIRGWCFSGSLDKI